MPHMQGGRHGIMEKKSKVFDFRSLFKNEKAFKTLLVGALALIALLFVSDAFSQNDRGGSNPAAVSDYTAYEEYEKRLEQKLERAISAIDGVGEFTIVVTLDSLSENVYSERGSGVRTVITPKVRGVAIVCEGGENVIVKQKLIELVSRVLGINTTRISVTS